MQKELSKVIKYIDCDGVILDTETGLFDDYNKLKQIDPTLKRGNYLQQLDWHQWLRQAKIIKNAIEILKQNDPLNVSILTMVHSQQEGLEKIQYFSELGLKNKVIIVPNEVSKAQFVSANGNILVDNGIRNLDDWALYNGISIFFNEYGNNMDTFNEKHTLNDKYLLITSLDSLFSEETNEYVKTKIMNK